MRADPPSNQATVENPAAYTLMTRLVAWLLSGISVLTIALVLVQSSASSQVLMSRLGFIAVSITALLLCWQHRTRMAARILLWGAWLLTLEIVYHNGGLHAPQALSFPIQIALFAWLLGTRATVWMACLSCAFLLGMLYLETQQTLPVPRSQTPVFLMTYVVGNAVFAVSVALLMRTSHLGQVRLVQAGDTLRREQEQQLRKLQRLVEQSPNSVVITDSERRISYVNPAFELSAGRSRASVTGRHSAEVSTQGLRPEQHQAIEAAMRHGEPWRGEQVLGRPQGRRLFESIEILPLRDDDGRIMDWFELKRDISERRWAAEQIDRLAYFDALTHLPNRAALRDRLDEALGAGEPPQTLVILKLLGLPQINQGHGPAMGDELLRQQVQRLREAIPVHAQAYRLCGARFVVLLPGSAPQQAPPRAAGEALARVLRCALGAALLLGSEIQPVRTAIRQGATLLPESLNDSVDAVLQRAEAALSEALQDAEERLTWFRPRQIAHARQCEAREREWRQECERNELQLQIHRLVDAQGRSWGLCAGARWRHPIQGSHLPAEGVPPQQLPGWARWLDHWTLQQLGRWLSSQAHPAHGSAAALSVMLNSRLEADDGLPGGWPGSELHGLSLNLVLPTLTARPDTRGIQRFRTGLLALAEAGHAVSLHGFGLGYPNVLDLAGLPLRQVHLHPLLGEAPLDQGPALALRSTLIGLCRQEGLQSVAEAPLGERQRQRLLELHPDLLCLELIEVVRMPSVRQPPGGAWAAHLGGGA